MALIVNLLVSISSTILNCCTAQSTPYLSFPYWEKLIRLSGEKGDPVCFQCPRAHI